TQEILLAKGYGNNDSFLATLKEIRNEQLDRMYSYNGCIVDVAAAKANIAAATTAQAINDAYFNAITTPEYFTRIANRTTIKEVVNGIEYEAVQDDGLIKANFFYPWVIPSYANNIK
ncbi:MAG: hypothetical protein MJ193_04650, partial [Clostridia bacterium]|nr:hypothetical protein [Clostridia bacterium]